MNDTSRRNIERRAFLGYFAGTGLAATLLPGTLYSQVALAQSNTVTPEMVASAEKLAGLEFSPEEREQIAKGVNANVRKYKQIRELNIPNDVPPAFQFNPVPPDFEVPSGEDAVTFSNPNRTDRPSNLEDVAHWSLIELAGLIRTRQVSSLELTTMYLDRAKRFNDELNCFITFTEDRAITFAKHADRQSEMGNYHSIVHGIPWGAKDLLAVRHYPTTFGATPFKDQVIDVDATVVKRLDAAGAVLIGKLSLGALAQNNVWMGKETKNPWNTDYGSSGSSAGPGSATSAGLVGFSIGSETNGSITSPSTVCGVTGLRPTFGRVSRHGAMALSWTMDKLGPMCRTVEDCAAVFSIIHGKDGHDSTAVDVPFNWDPKLNPKSLRVGYLDGAFEEDDHNKESLNQLRGQGFELFPIKFPELSYNHLNFILTTESAAAFDELTLSNRDDELIRSAWPQAFRNARTVPAVEYIQANRARTLLMREVNEVMKKVDVFITPTMQHLLLGNLTGHPLVCVPDGFNRRDVPTSIAFFGGLYKESEVLAVAKAFQDANGSHLKTPPKFS